MLVLAIDTSANLCAACVWDASAGELGREVRDIGKGHAEQLMDVVARAVSTAGIALGDVARIGVSVGPGSFTGVRIGVAAARGFALALQVPSCGISTLEALAAEARDAYPGREALALIDAGRDDVYVAGYDRDGGVSLTPAVVAMSATIALVEGKDPVLAGSAAEAVAQSAGRTFEIASNTRTSDIAVYARLAALKDKGALERPRPLYLRGADAKPQTGFALPRKDRA